MRQFERILVRFTAALCKIFDVTPEQIEKHRAKDRPKPQRRSAKPPYFEA